MRYAGKEPFPTIYVDSKEEGKVGQIISSSSFGEDSWCVINIVNKLY